MLDANLVNIADRKVYSMITDKKIVLTGATMGIGFEVLKLLYKGNGNVILAVARNVDRLVGFADNVIPFKCDVSSKEGVDAIFEEAERLFGKIDIFYCNAGYSYYEEFNYTDWDRVKRLYETNTFSPIYSYAKYIKHLDGREGVLAYTLSAMGQMAMPGYAVYGSSKFAMHGFQQAIRLEMPKNLQLTCLYPVATESNFFKTANTIEFEKPFPVQKPEIVARKMVKGIEKGKKYVSPCVLFDISKLLMGIFPPSRTIYWGIEKAKFERFKNKVREAEESLKKENASHGI